MGFGSNMLRPRYKIGDMKMNTGLLHVKLPIIPHVLASKILSQKMHLCISAAYSTIYQAKDTVNATLECIL